MGVSAVTSKLGNLLLRIQLKFQNILNCMKLTAEQSQFVEQTGRFWESTTGSRNAGRILGLLMICEPDHQSSADIVEALDVSAGSVSTQVRHLEQIGLVERLTFRGDRASYYRLPDRAWSKLMEGELQRIAEMRKLAESGTQVLPDSRPERVTELGLIVDFFADEWPALMGRLRDRLTKERT